MTIEFNYEVKFVDEVNNCIEVLFKKEGFPDYLCSVPKPKQDEDMYTVLKQFAPFAAWAGVHAGSVPIEEPVDTTEPVQRIVLETLKR